jgi:DNA-binding winged helix-turn-helix (wHTH) protein/energy-coupling factor transporter ATP-binding protein EcfA2
MPYATQVKSAARFRFGDWHVDTVANVLSRDGARRQLEPRTMEVLAFLCRRPNEVLSAEEILEGCWGNAIQGDNPLHKVLSQLRHALGDSAVAPRYIETIRKRGYRAIAEVACEPPPGPTWRDSSPFRGLEAFRLEHAAVFRGREAATAALVDTLSAQSDKGCALAVVLGPSGSGKTSLIQAGLLPHLMAGRMGGAALADAVTFDCADIGGATLFEALGSVLLDAEVSEAGVFPGESAATLGERLASDMPWVQARLRNELGRALLFLFVDRLEAVFRASHLADAQRFAFLECVEQLGRCGVVVVIACRNDFYPQLMACTVISALKTRGGHFDLASPDATEIAQIIRLPALAAGLAFEVDDASGTGLDDLLCQAAQGGADVLPLLEYCLHELYRRRGADGVLTLAVYRELGGIEGAISARAEEVIARLGPAEVGALPRVLSQLVSIAEEESMVTARRAPLAALDAGPEHELVKALVEARLFVTDLSAGSATYGVAHEALLRRWPRAAGWIDKHRQALQQRTRVAAQAARWHASGRAGDLLLPPGMQARQAELLTTMPELGLARLERDYIAASSRKARRVERLRWLVFGLVATLAVLASILGLAAFAAQQRAEGHRTEAEGLMAFMLGELVDKVRPLGRLDLLDSVSERALHYLSDASRLEERPVALMQRSKALQLIAEVKIARGDSAGARQALLAARRILDQLAGLEPANREVLASLGANAFWLGQIHFDRNEWAAARQRFEEYARFADRMAAAAPGDADAWIEQSYARNSLGSVALKQGDTGAAVQAFSASVMLKARALASKKRDAVLQADLADSISWLASATVQLGELDTAMRLFQHERSLLRPLLGTGSGDGLWRHRHALALRRQAELHFARGDNAAGMALLAQSVQLLRQLVLADPSNLDWRTDTDSTELQLLAAQGNPADAARLDTLHRNFTARHALEPGKIDPARLAAVALEVKAALQLAQDQANAARTTLNPALASLQRLHAATPADPALRESLVATLLLQARIERAAGHQRAALLACQHVTQVLAPVIVNSADFKVLSAWVRAQHCLGAPAKAAAQRRRLDQIGYRDPQYLASIFSPPP